MRSLDRSVASSLDAHKEGAWMREGQDEDKRRKNISNKRGVLRFAKGLANQYVRQVTSGKKAYDAHRGCKVLIRYEDLRADPVVTMKRVCSELKIPASDEDIRRVVEVRSWKNVPGEEKGQKQFYRKATPGGWRKDLTPEQASLVEGITTSLIAEFYR